MFSDDNDFIEDELDALDLGAHVRNVPREKQHSGGKRKLDGRKKQERLQTQAQLQAQSDHSGEQFNFTYLASRHERAWIVDSLGSFYEEHWLDDVLRLIKGGKEAHVYQCRAHETLTGLDQPYLAAKVYRPRQFRNLRNDAMYRAGRDALDADGRTVIDDRMLRAMSKRTAYGQTLSHISWIEHEVKTMKILHAAGADVPEVFISGHNAILMTYIGAAEMAAPTLNSVDLGRSEARQLFERTMENIDLMLANGRIHGDLSAYNILYWEGEITLIDFPQAIDPHVNRNAFQIFGRDVQRVCEYFARQGVRVQPGKLAAEMWAAHGHRLAPEVDPAYLDPEDKQDRSLWQRASRG